MISFASWKWRVQYWFVQRRRRLCRHRTTSFIDFNGPLFTFIIERCDACGELIWRSDE